MKVQHGFLIYYRVEMCFQIYLWYQSQVTVVWNTKEIGNMYTSVSRVRFKPPLVDDTSYEADALPTKPPRQIFLWDFCYNTARYNTAQCAYLIMY